jgi:hypothetical protein
MVRAPGGLSDLLELFQPPRRATIQAAQARVPGGGDFSAGRCGLHIGAEGRRIFADIDDAQAHLRRRYAHAHVGRARDRHLAEAQFEFGCPRLALADLGLQR